MKTTILAGAAALALMVGGAAFAQTGPGGTAGGGQGGGGSPAGDTGSGGSSASDVNGGNGAGGRGDAPASPSGAIAQPPTIGSNGTQTQTQPSGTTETGAPM